MALNTNIVLAGLPNLGDYFTLYAGSQAVSSIGQQLGPGNLQNWSLANFWRSTANTRSSCWIRGDTCSLNYPLNVGAVGIVGHLMDGQSIGAYNAAPTASGLWRFRGMGFKGAPLGGGHFSAVQPLWGRVTPSAINSSSNYTGTVSAIQDGDPENPDGNWLTATTPGTATTLNVSFQNCPGLSLYNAGATDTGPTGVTVQTFRVLARRTSAGTASSLTLTLTLKYGGTSYTVVTHSVTSTTPQLFTFYWDASVMSGNLDSSVTLEIDGAAGSGSSIEVGAVEWCKEYSTTQPDGFGGYYPFIDTGYLPVVLPSSYLERPTTLTEAWYTSNPSAVDTFWIDLQDTGNTRSYLQFGRLIVSQATTFQVGVDANYGLKWTDATTVTRSKGGTPYAYRGAQWREFAGKLGGVTEAEVFGTLLDQLDRQKGLGGNFLFSLFPDASNYGYLRTFYAMLKSLDPVAEFTPDGRYERALNIQEIT